MNLSLSVIIVIVFMSSIIDLSSCQSSVRGCLASWRRYKNERRHASGRDALCDVFSHYTDCLGRCSERFGDRLPAEFRVSWATSAYTCDESRRDEVRRIIGHDCIRSGLLFPMVSSFVQPCSRIIRAAGQRLARRLARMEQINAGVSMCPAYTGFIRCVVGRVGDVCGESIKPYVAGMLNDVTRASVPPHLRFCFNSSA